MSLIETEDHFMHTAAFPPVLQDVNAALWEFNIQTKQLKCSSGFYEMLGYTGKEISYYFFINNILYYEDIPHLLKETNSCETGRSKSLEIRLMTSEGFQWFQNTFRREAGGILAGSIINIHQFKVIEFELANKNKRYASVVRIAGSGSWEIDIKTRSLTISKEACHILELKEKTELNIADLIRYFIPEHRPILTSSINAGIELGKPFDLDLQMRTSSSTLIWVKIKGLTSIDELGRGVTLKGLLQNIDQSKRKEKELHSTFEFLEHQNKRLQNFAYMVSHNLRSHASNLQYLVKMHEDAAEESEKKEIFSHITTISDSLNTTVQHLNEIVKMESDIQGERLETGIEPVFKNVVNALESNIEQSDATISYDFTACPVIRYIPAYLESIIHNFLTNSLKYRHPERKPVITCTSELADNYCYLIFQDNGIGIDMERYGKKVFGMYQTFHNHPDAKGIGLFITRNQVEALGGNIEIDSKVGRGTRFRVRLCRQEN